MVSSQLSEAMAQHTSRLLGIRITISLWRHIATWFLNHHSVRHQESVTLSNRAMLASQTGHGEKMHGSYGGDARIPSDTDFHIFFGTMKLSGVWHELLGFDPELSNAMGATHSVSSPQVHPSV